MNLYKARLEKIRKDEKEIIETLSILNENKVQTIDTIRKLELEYMFHTSTDAEKKMECAVKAYYIGIHTDDGEYTETIHRGQVKDFVGTIYDLMTTARKSEGISALTDAILCKYDERSSNGIQIKTDDFIKACMETRDLMHLILTQ
ncbi:unnamed protein product [Didymodactylos carnosus]|uniref:Uncharacterized protein n=1 Tax=Didymodactylos carnosus TaxID=1234261 RepID=A0A815BZC4_9BILA|nr:unnamed protein product [Didymodactylos carnosus]CAF1350142.1 unnamed protein product [Didymodactylos carnosus]CAF4074461.1 unnamed protein product [Didymodactylos carnosus]CAF4160869.1 unnamed protein product [Didymodactylos carnosus]